MHTAPAPGASRFHAIGATNRIHVTDPRVLHEATMVAEDYVSELDAAVSRFRDDSEVSRLAARARREDAWCFGSPLFVDHLRAGLRAARLTDGLVDFTVGSALVASGYDADMDEVRARATWSTPTTRVGVPGWRRVTLDEATGRISTPQGTLIDLGSVAKAHAADVIARRLADRLPGGFLVNLGGDIAVSGAAPRGGWRVGVEAADGVVRQVISVVDQGVATSSTQLRTWATADGTAHHIIDPRTGRTAETVWAHVTCVAVNAFEANTASTAALVLGEDAPGWLSAHGLAARLDRVDGSTTLTPGWPDPSDVADSDPGTEAI